MTAASGDLPRTIGRYKIEARLSGSAADDVYRGFDPMIERPVVVKVFRLNRIDAGADAALKQAFYQEMQRTGLLMHHGIAALFDAGEEPGILYMATEFVDGDSLAERFAAGLAWDLPARVSVVAQMLDALDFACQLGVPHLNLKPTNIVIGPAHSVKVGGFGVGSFLSRLTAASSTPVTSVSPYAAPERAAGQTGDQRSDVYSAALIARDLLLGPGVSSGLPPFIAERSVDADQLDGVFQRATDADPSRRYPTPETLKLELMLTLGVGDTHVWYDPALSSAGGEAPADAATILTPSGVYLLPEDTFERPTGLGTPRLSQEESEAPTMMEPKKDPR